MAWINGVYLKLWMFTLRLSHSGRAVHVAYANQAAGRRLRRVEQAAATQGHFGHDECRDHGHRVPALFVADGEVHPPVALKLGTAVTALPAGGRSC
jgi:hypothetical protein